MFTASESFLVFDYLRVPYVVGGRVHPLSGDLAVLALDRAPRRKLLWPASAGRLFDGTRSEGHSWRGAAMFAQVIPDDVMMDALGPGWSPVEPVTNRIGTAVGSIWRDAQGAVCLPFDPGLAITAFWSEAYLGVLNGGYRDGPSRHVRLYYLIRPIIPRWLQIVARRVYARRSGRVDFPGWPTEPALHDLVRAIFELVTEVAGEAPPWIAPWPAPYRWAFTLTHDVETHAGYARIREISDLEGSLAYRSAWNLVPRRYAVEDGALALIAQAGGEVGLHGLHHDGRDLASREVLDQRLPEMHEHAAAWGAIGFRSPSTQRRWDLMPALRFDYDSSYSHSDPYEPQPGGTCTWLPYMIGDMVELPITLPQDHTLFVILGHRTATTWLEAAAMIRARGGMVLLLTHPDYLGNRRAMAAYRELLTTYANDETAWHALPREVSSWWRRRAASRLVRSQSGWRIEGPAADEGAITRDTPG